jgi:hypothetical protein
MNTKSNTWGYPGPSCTEDQKINYSNQIISLDKNLSNDIDLVMIDGRFRVACCLKCFNVINNECLIAFDDFLDRPEYHIVLIYYEIVDQTDDDRMVILKKKQNIKSIPDKLIKKYELDKY